MDLIKSYSMLLASTNTSQWVFTKKKQKTKNKKQKNKTKNKIKQKTDIARGNFFFFLRVRYNILLIYMTAAEILFYLDLNGFYFSKTPT